MKLRLKLSDLEDDIGIISVSCGTLVESGLSNGAVMMVDSIDPSSSPVFIIEYAMKHPGPKSHLFYHIATDGNNYSIIRFICIDCYCGDVPYPGPCRQSGDGAGCQPVYQRAGDAGAGRHFR